MPSHGHEPAELRGHEHEHAATGAGAMHAFGESRFAHEERHAVATPDAPGESPVLSAEVASVLDIEIDDIGRWAISNAGLVTHLSRQRRQQRCPGLATC